MQAGSDVFSVEPASSISNAQTVNAFSSLHWIFSASPLWSDQDVFHFFGNGLILRAIHQRPDPILQQPISQYRLHFFRTRQSKHFASLASLFVTRTIPRQVGQKWVSDHHEMEVTLHSRVSQSLIVSPTAKFDRVTNVKFCS